MSLRKATRNRIQFTNDESAVKTLWLMICNIEDKRALKRAKKQKGIATTRLVEKAQVTNLETSHQPKGHSPPQPIPQQPSNQTPHTNNTTYSGGIILVNTQNLNITTGTPGTRGIKPDEL